MSKQVILSATEQAIINRMEAQRPRLERLAEEASYPNDCYAETLLAIMDLIKLESGETK